MLFLINNPVIAFIVLAVFGLTVYTVNKIIVEVRLNRELRFKQRAMRVKNPAGKIGKRMSLLGAQAIIPTALVIGAFIVGANLQVEPTGAFQQLSSSDDVVNLFNDFQERMGDDYWRGGFLGGEPVFDAVEEAATDDSTNDSGTGSDDYSETNNQVIGVDEMDNVLTDGMYIYALYGNELTITLAFTQEQGVDVLSLEKTITYQADTCEEDHFYPMGLYVDDERLLVIGNSYIYNCDPEKYGEDGYYDYEYRWYGYSSEVKVLSYDKDDFELQDEYTFNGYFTGTRKIDDTLYIITNEYIPFEDEEDFNVDNYLPYYEVNEEQQLVDYEEIYYVDGTNPNTFTAFYAVDLVTKEVDMEVILGNTGYNLYVSNNNIYLVGGVYYFWPLADLVDVEEPVQEYRTAIMRVSIDGASLEFSGVGYVEGYTLNQFSMDEYNGYLRIATTEGWWGEDINNRVWILDEELQVASMIENLGKPGETIRSVRFSGEWGYVVTFEQTDPFYVLDLSDPDNPEVEGELEIPGFSTYLQNINENYMLGIGFNADNEGRVNGMKISIYDITDKSNPVVFDEKVFLYEDFGWSHSSATYNHKDLLVSASKGIIALPFSSYEWTEDGHKYNSGILVYDFDFEDGLSFNGYVQHELDSDWNIYVYKSKFIDNYFYTVSNKYIKVSPIDDVENVLDSVLLREIESHYYYGTDEAVD